MLNPRMVAVLIVFTIIVVIEPFRVALSDHSFSTNYFVILTIYFLAVITGIVYFIYSLRSRKKAREQFENLQKNVDFSILDEGDWHYQEPIHMLDNHPIRIVENSGDSKATYEIKYKNKFERIVSLIGVLNYNNIKMTDNLTGDIIYFERYPTRSSLIRTKWSVYMNNKLIGILEAKKISNEQIKNQFVYTYSIRNQEYTIVSKRFNTLTRIYNNHDKVIFEANRTLFNFNKRGSDGARGRKHSLNNNDINEELTKLEKIGIYQQVMMEVK